MKGVKGETYKHIMKSNKLIEIMKHDNFSESSVIGIRRIYVNDH